MEALIRVTVSELVYAGTSSNLTKTYDLVEEMRYINPIREYAIWYCGIVLRIPHGSVNQI